MKLLWSNILKKCKYKPHSINSILVSRVWREISMEQRFFDFYCYKNGYIPIYNTQMNMIPINYKYHKHRSIRNNPCVNEQSSCEPIKNNNTFNKPIYNDYTQFIPNNDKIINNICNISDKNNSSTSIPFTKELYNYSPSSNNTKINMLSTLDASLDNNYNTAVSRCLTTIPLPLENQYIKNSCNIYNNKNEYRNDYSLINMNNIISNDKRTFLTNIDNSTTNNNDQNDNTTINSSAELIDDIIINYNEIISDNTFMISSKIPNDNTFMISSKIPNDNTLMISSKIPNDTIMISNKIPNDNDNTLMKSSNIPNDNALMKSSKIPNDNTLMMSSNIPNDNTLMKSSNIPNDNTLMKSSNIPNDNTLMKSSNIPNDNTLINYNKIPGNNSIINYGVLNYNNLSNGKNNLYRNINDYQYLKCYPKMDLPCAFFFNNEMKYNDQYTHLLNLDFHYNDIHILN
ncbi:hypothetical protein PIROE2DRAFT_3500 [Piromyces sp. E2]|nr:hypothetical protein PIROE2DRAFT_3500 [Piromyces sp. E2]|eukprot:OUM68801.1 hypothetical protein PIROE2DRAFT_3500 [Piromyces sp. E2]